MKITYTLMMHGREITMPIIYHWDYYVKLHDFINQLKLDNFILKSTLIEQFKHIFSVELPIDVIIAFLEDTNCSVKIFENEIEFELFKSRKEYKQVIGELQQVQAEVRELKRQMKRVIND